MTKKVFTPAQVVYLMEWQNNGMFHAFTCPNHADQYHQSGLDILFPTVRGWICPFCDYTQDWAHEFMKLPVPYASQEDPPK